MPRTAIHKSLQICTICLSAVILSACHSSRKVTVRNDSAYASTILKPSKSRPTTGATGSLLKEAESWLGTPYKYGGTDRDGVDCSGFVLRVYKDALGIALPRNSRAQRDFCPWTDMSSLYPGDLLFFSSDSERDHVTHVGIFVGDNQMIHASTSRGVIVTDITTAYYKRNYMGGGIVEQYHAMNGVPAAKKQGEIHISPLESPTGFKLTPAEGLPRRVNDAEKPVKAVKAEDSKPLRDVPANISPDDARAAVLGTLSEQPLSTR